LKTEPNDTQAKRRERPKQRTSGKNLASEEIPQENFLHHIPFNVRDLSLRCG